MRDCEVGRHVASRAAMRSEGGQRVSHCARCGCRLVKNPVTRCWYVSGLLG
jgi:hypothetical protein